MKRNNIEVSVVIANFNGAKFIVECINSLLEDPSNSYEIIIVDDGSSDDSSSIIKEHFSKEKKVQLFSFPKNQGPTFARNYGAQKSKGRYLFFLDLDTVVNPGWLKEITNFFSHHPNTAAIQAKILKKGTHQYDYAGDYIGPFGFLIERAQAALDTGQFDTPAKIFSVKGAAMIFDKRKFNKVGGFDEDYRYVWEEPDITWRLWLQGYEVYFAPTIVVHHAYQTGKKDMSYYKMTRIHYYGCRNTITTLIKNLELFSAIKIVPINLVCWLVIAAMFLLKGNAFNAAEVVRGVFWNVMNIKNTIRKRSIIQSVRKISDDTLFQTVGKKRSWYYYMRKAHAYLTNMPY